MANAHIVTRFDKKLNQIKDRVFEMGELVDTQIEGASELLEVFDAHKADRLIVTDRRVNGMNKGIHTRSERLIALRQPVAIDLRRALLPINIAAELERIGDHAKSTAKRARLLADAPQAPTTMATAQKMSGLVRAMLGDVMTAYRDCNIELAADIRARDKDVDSLNKALLEAALQAIRKSPELAEFYVHTILLARNLERDGDHIVNIARHVHQIVTGEDLKAS